ncbi:MAG: hypothetical protein ABF586_10190 [Sporolactobacillus sp.]
MPDSFSSPILGTILILLGFAVLIRTEKILLSASSLRGGRINRRFLGTMTVILILAGVYLLLAPILFVMMGDDYWILFVLGIFACLMLLIRLLMP